MKTILTCLVFTVSLCCFPVIAASDDSVPTDPVEPSKFKVDTELMEIRTVVTDQKGQIVEGLTKEDFELLENDGAQEISHFMTSKIESGQRREGAGEGEVLDKDSSLQLTQMQLSEPPVRTILLYVDALHLSFTSLNRVKQALNRFIDEQMTDQDLVAFTSSETLGVAQQFTRDKNILRYAIERIKLGPVKHDSFFSPSLAVDVLAEREEAIRVAVDIVRKEGHPQCPCNQLRSLVYNRASQVLLEASYWRSNTLEIIKHFSGQMKDLPGKRMIVVFSDGFTLYDITRGQQMDDLQKAVSQAVRSGVAIYSIDAKGMQAPMTIDAGSKGIITDPMFDLLYECVEDCKRDYEKCLEDGTDPTWCSDILMDCVEDCWTYNASPLVCREELLRIDRACSPGHMGMLEHFVDMSELEKLNGLNSIAQETGGKMYENTNDLNVALGWALDDNRFFYVLSYYPDAKKEDKQFRRIEVRVRDHPEYTVRTPRGFWPSNISEQLEDDTAKTPQQRLIEALGSPLPVTDIGVSAQADYIESESDDKQVSLTVYFEGDQFKYKDKEQGGIVELEIISAIYDSSGDRVDGISAHVEGSLTPEDMARVQTSGYQFSRRLPLEPGAYQARIGVREEGTNRMGTATTWVEVPKLVPDTFEMSSLILSNPLDMDLIDAEGIDVGKLEQVKIIQGVPMYARDDIFYYSFRVYRERPDSVGSDLSLMRELLQGGKPVLTEQWIPISTEPVDADSKGWFDFDGELDIETLDTGVYELRIRIREDGSDKDIQRNVAFGIL